jgi:hypothetical protein
MPLRRRAEERPGVRWQRQRAWASSIVIGGFVLFLWPFVRTPPLTIGLSYAHLLGAWVAVVAGLFAMSRALAGGSRGGDDDDG